MSSTGRPRRRGNGVAPQRVSAATIRRRRQVAAMTGLLLAVAVAVVAIIALSGGGTSLPAPGLAGPGAVGAGSVYEYVPSESAEYAARAAAGSAQVLYTKSPGGVIATAARVARYRKLIAVAVRGTNIPVAELEGLVFVESAGRPNVVAGTSAADAAGLTQILAGTGRVLLGMRISLARSERLTRLIARALAQGDVRRAGVLEREREAIDPRFDPAAELAATVRYLRIAERDLGGRVDLAVAAYHAGIGNIQQVLGDYDDGRIVSYTRLYFDISPSDRAAAYDLLESLGDDSSLYLWRVLGAERIMSLYRGDRAALTRLNNLETAYPSDAEVLVPPDSGTSFADSQALTNGYTSGAIVPLPRNAAALHLAYAPSMGSGARDLGVPRSLYRGLRPGALRLLISIAAEVHAIAPSGRPLIVAGSVVDGQYLSSLAIIDPEASTGYTFSIARRYASGTEADAFQFVLDRLASLNLIGWIREPATIEITAAPDAGTVLSRGV